MCHAQIAFEKIEIPLGRRPLDNAKVTALAESIRQIGLRTPITTRRVPREDGYVWLLVAGHHRIEAMRQLGEARIDAIAVEAENDTTAKLWEIAENLHRANLSAQEEADQTQRWRELIRDEQVGISSPPVVELLKKHGRSGQEQPGSIRHTARAFKIDAKEARNRVRIF
jgi:hypothetical protein